MDLEPGRLIAPNLRLKRLLKSGGMGSVWVADHVGLGTEVAVKFMSPSLLTDKAMMARFSREALAAAHIQSPHVVQILDHGVTEDGWPFIAMELLHGEELSTRIKRAGPLSLREVGALIAQVARGLTKAHEAGVVHRDIKPDNLFLTEVDGHLFVKILDFGVAKQERATTDFGLTTTGSLIGTPFYMSPEQLLSAKRADFRSDLWSLAVVAYRAITARVPFRGETLGALCVSMDRGHFPAPSSIREGVPAAVDAWFVTAMARDPAKRFHSAREMVEAFDRAVGLTEATFNGASITSDALAQAAPPSDRRPLATIAVVSVAVGAIAALLFFKARAPGAGAAPRPSVIVVSTTAPVDPSAAATTTDAPNASAPAASEIPSASAPPAEPSSVAAAAATQAASAPPAGHHGGPVVVDKHKKRGF